MSKKFKYEFERFGVDLLSLKYTVDYINRIRKNNNNKIKKINKPCNLLTTIIMPKPNTFNFV